MSAAKGSSLQGYNAELVKCIEDLREKREELNRAILRDEEEKAKIQKVRGERRLRSGALFPRGRNAARCRGARTALLGALSPAARMGPEHVCGSSRIREGAAEMLRASPAERLVLTPLGAFFPPRLSLPLPFQDLTRLTERLSRINEDIARRMQARNEFDSTIQETEAAYMKVRVLPFCSSKRGGAVVGTGPRHLALLSLTAFPFPNSYPSSSRRSSRAPRRCSPC
jgi:DNA repair exonuclease SbcCD ATPase subunit